MTNMDQIDKKIFCLLEENSRRPISQIAKKLKINRGVVSYRIQNLLKSKIIREFIASVDLGMFGYESYKIYLKTQDSNRKNELIKHLAERKEVIHLIDLEGFYDLSFVMVAKSIHELDYFLTEIKTIFEDLIEETDISIVVYSKIFKFEKLLLGIHKETLKIEKYAAKKKNIDIDETDKKILHELSHNARASYVELAQATGQSLDVITYRMKKIKKDIISSFRVLFDLNAFGYFHYVILIKTKQMTKMDEERFNTWSERKENVMYCTKRIGRHDFEINIAISDINHLREFMKELKEQFSNNIKSHETIIVNNVLKLNYIPF